MKPISLIVFSSYLSRSCELGRDLVVAALRGPSRRARRGSRTSRGLPARRSCGSRIRPSSISTLQRSATSSVRRIASSWPGKSSAISSRRLEVEVVGLELPVVRVLERVAGLDAEERLVCARVGVAQVVDVAGRDGRQPLLRGELDELRQDPRLHVEVRVLQLDVDVVARRTICARRSSSPSASVDAVLLERLADAPARGSRRARSARSSGARAAPSRRAACSSSPRGSRGVESLIRFE